MFDSHSGRRTLLALTLTLSAVLLSWPLGAAPQEPVEPMGSMNAVGRVQLRGVAIEGPGTLFSGDEIRTASEGYAQISLNRGAQIELSENTNTRVDSSDSGIQVNMESGSLAFASPASSGQLEINADSWQVEGADGSVANVALLEGNELGVRAVNGSVTVRSALTDETLVVEEGEARIVSLSDDTGSLAGPAGPEPLPVPRRQLLDREWIAVGITAGVIGAAVGTWLLLRDEASPDTP